MSTAMNPPKNPEETLFEAARKLTRPEAVQAFLEAACEGDAALRRRVEELLTANAEAEAFFAGQNAPTVHHPSEAARAVTSAQNSQASEGERPGSVVGRYKLREKIGEGGCGVVYVAEQEEPVRRRVALKVIKLGMDTKSVVARFEAERQALAMMDHPNIAKVLDAGTTDAGLPYFVMELVRGMKITEYCDKVKLPTQQRLNLFIQVCNAVQHAHQKGIIHRDIKPSNILVTLHDGVPVPKVIDFGIAKATEGRLTDKTVYTELHQFIGTPAYMSPEQAEMSGLDIDTRSDIYSLGVLLYELLTGRTPFDAKELLDAGFDEMRRRIREVEPPRPSTRLSTLAHADLDTVAKARGIESPKLRTLLRGDLDWIVMKCLEKDRTRRYETANGVAMDIKRYLNTEAVLARPPSAVYRLQKVMRRNKGAVFAITVVALVLVLGVVASMLQAIRATKAEREQSNLREIAVSAKTVAEQARADEAHQRVEAVEQRAKADANALQARRIAYVSDINLAQLAVQAHDVGRVLEHLNRHRPKSGETNDLRGWEWRYLWQLCKSDAEYTLLHTSNNIDAMSLSGDGRFLALGGRKLASLSVWDVRSRAEIFHSSTNDLALDFSFAFMPTRPILAFPVSSPDGTSTVRLWDCENQRLSGELPHSSAILDLAFSSDGKLLVTLSTETERGLQVWNLSEPGTHFKLVKQLAASASASRYNWFGHRLAVAPDRSQVVYGGETGTISVLDLNADKERWRSKFRHTQPAVSVSLDSKTVAATSTLTDFSIKLWDASTGAELGALQGHQNFVTSLLFLPDNQTLVSASADRTIRLWNIVTRESVRVLQGHLLPVHDLAVMPDGSTLLSLCRDGTVAVWNTKTPEARPTRIELPFGDGEYGGWTFSSDSKSLFTCSASGQIARWSGPDFANMESIGEAGLSSYYFALSSDDRLLATGHTNGIIRIWDTAKRQEVRRLLSNSRGTLASPLAFIDGGKKLISAEGSFKSQFGNRLAVRNSRISEWDLSNEREIKSKNLDQFGGFPRLAVAGDGSTLAVCIREGLVSLWRLPDFSEVASKDLKIEAFGHALSGEGKLLAVGNAVGDIWLWDSRTLEARGTFQRHSLSISSVAFAPDGERLASGSTGSEAVKVWDMHTQQTLLTLEGRDSHFSHTRFSPDGNVLGSQNANGVLHLWRAPSWDEIAAAEKLERTRSQ